MDHDFPTPLQMGLTLAAVVVVGWLIAWGVSSW